jgi:hypothetical protein
MIFITQLVYVKEGQEQVFHQFEEIAIPAILKYNGRLLLRVRPNEESFIEHHIDKPYEIHLVEFADEQDFINFWEGRRAQEIFTPERTGHKIGAADKRNKAVV